MLEIKNLQVNYKNQTVLHHLNLNVEEGSVFGLLGKNGAGKTTLFESLYQSKKHEGEILWQGKKLLRENISYLETDNFFYPYITGKEYLQYFTSDKKQLQEWSEIFSLPLEKYVQDYSTGMKKKIALVGMLLLNKPVNILDEPFNGVDFEGVNLLYDVISQLRNENKLIIISSHIIETLFNTCDKIGVLKEGRIDHIFVKEDFHQLKSHAF